MTGWRIVCAIGFPWLVGLGVVRAIPEVWAVRPLRWGIGFGLGAGLLTVEMLAFAQLGWPWSVSALTPLPALAALGAAAWGRRGPRAAGALRSGSPGAWRRAARVALGLILLALVGGAVVRAGLVPLSGWDAVAIWGFKGRAFYVDGTIRPALLLEPSRRYSHPEYPLHVPLLMTWLGLFLGEWDDRAVALWFPAYYAALLLVVYGALAPGRSVEGALAWTAGLATCPQIGAHATVAMADLPLAYAVTATSVVLAPTLAGDGWRLAVVGGALGGLAGWTKNEGLAWLVVIAGCVALRSTLAGQRRGRIVATLVPFLGFGLVVALPWLGWRLAWGLEEDVVSIKSALAGLADAPARLWRIGRALAGEAVAVSRWNLLWPLFLAASGVAVGRGHGCVASWYAGVAWAGLGVYGLTYLLAALNLSWLLATFLERVLLHVAPLALLAAAWGLGSSRSRDGRSERARPSSAQPVSATEEREDQG